MKRFSAVLTATLFFCLGLICLTPAMAQAADTTTGATAPAAMADAQSGSTNPAIAEKAQSTKDLVGSEVSGFQPQLHRTLQALLMVSCLVLLGFGLYSKFGAKLIGRKVPESALISIVSRHSFGPRSALLVTDVDGQRFLLAQTNDEIRMLSRLQAPARAGSSLEDLLESAENNKIAAIDILKLASNS